MPLSLTYDPVLSRVRITAGKIMDDTNPSFEAGTAGWFASGGVIARVNTVAHDGTWSGTLTPDGVTATPQIGRTASGSAIPAVVDTNYRMDIWVYVPPGYGTVVPAIAWLNAADGIISTSTGPPVAVPAATWVALTLTGAAPALTAKVSGRVQMTGTPGVGIVLHVDQFTITELLPAAADRVTIERSPDNVNWTTVRGGTNVPIVNGVASLDDYEFYPDVVNYYRMRSREDTPIAFVGVGTGDTDNNANVQAGLPAGTVVGDLVVQQASIRTGTVTNPTGWTVAMNAGNLKIFTRIYDGVWTMPIIAFTGGALGDDTMVQSAAWRRATVTPVGAVQQQNAIGQNIDFPTLGIPEDNCLIIAFGWKQDDWTSVDPLPLMTEINERISTLGNDAAQVWDYMIQTVAETIAAGVFIVTGGATAISRGGLLAFARPEYLSTEQDTITPDLDGKVWFKSLIRPYLNRAVELTGTEPEFVAPARQGVFGIVGRTNRVAVTDVRLSEEFEVEIITMDAAEKANVRLMFASGDPLLLQVPADHCALETAYVVADTTRRRRQSPANGRNLFSVPLIEVAAPGPEIVGATVSWQSIISAFATWSDLMAVEPTWNDVLERIGSPTDVEVP